MTPTRRRPASRPTAAARCRRTSPIFVVALAVAGCAATPVATDRASSCAACGTELTAPASAQVVVLLHGLGRTHRSMRPLEVALEERGYRVVNIDYPSLSHSIDALTDSVHLALEACCGDAPGPVHFVTHSLGGILVRSYAERYGGDGIGRVVMLSPPNQGSEVVDRLGRLGLFEMLMGPAAVELGTGPTAAVKRLGPADFELGVITGDATLNPIFSWWLPGEDDGKVSVESACVAGTDAFLVVPYPHAFIMRRAEVIEEVAAFLSTGSFRVGADAAMAPGRAAAGCGGPG